MKKLLYLLMMTTLLVGCNQEEFEGYDTPFVHVSTSDGLSFVIVLTNVNNINEYPVMLSSRPRTSSLTVTYEIIVGNGLTEGVDYELLTKGNTLTFEPGVYDMPIRIKWKSHQVDKTKDNTLTIRLTETCCPMTLGLPGPDANQKELVITKQNQGE
ncbi:hypothetical protein [Prevotella sp.]|uniref:hypothetical protein n=1 Tax=Prevotella sp. TaxID=59823 RepID=UPI002F93BD92